MEDVEMVPDGEAAEKLVCSIRDGLRGDDAKRTSQFHVLDIMYPRQAVMKRLYGGARYSNRTALFFVAGRAHHEIIDRFLGGSGEVVEYQGIIGNIDRVVDGMVIEFKTTRGRFGGNVSLHYIEQHGYYSAMKYPDSNEHTGYIYVFHINDPAIVAYRVTHTALGGIRAYMVATRDGIVDVIVGKRAFDTLKTCPKWMCSDCGFASECRIMLGSKKEAAHVDKISWGELVGMGGRETERS